MPTFPTVPTGPLFEGLASRHQRDGKPGPKPARSLVLTPSRFTARQRVCVAMPESAAAFLTALASSGPSARYSLRKSTATVTALSFSSSSAGLRS